MSIFSKLRDFVGFSEPDGYEYEVYDEAAQREFSPAHPEESTANHEESESPLPRRNRERSMARPSISADMSHSHGVSNVIGMPSSVNGMSQVMVMEPRSFEEMPQAILALRERKSVVLNLTMMDPDQAQRAVDFVAGGTYALDGHQERIGDSIFLFAPSCVQVTSQSGVTVEPPVTRQPRPTAPTPTWAEAPMGRYAAQ